MQFVRPIRSPTRSSHNSGLVSGRAANNYSSKKATNARPSIQYQTIPRNIVNPYKSPFANSIGNRLYASIPVGGTKSPARQRPRATALEDPISTFERDLDRVFDSSVPSNFWSFVRPFFGSRLLRDMEREFDKPISWSPFRDELRFESPQWKEISNWKPKADIKATDNSYVIEAELPGCSKEDIKVNVLDDVVTISGSKKIESETTDEKHQYVRRERSAGSFMRRFQLPETPQTSNISAQFKEGVLRVEIPRTHQEETQGTDIPIDVESSSNTAAA